MEGEDTKEKNPVNNNKEYNFKILNFCHATTNWFLIKTSKVDTGEKRTFKQMLQENLISICRKTKLYHHYFVLPRQINKF